MCRGQVCGRGRRKGGFDGVMNRSGSVGKACFLRPEWSWMTTGLGSSWPEERFRAKEKERGRGPWESGLVAVRCPGFLGGNTGWNGPGRQCSREHCQHFVGRK